MGASVGTAHILSSVRFVPSPPVGASATCYGARVPRPRPATKLPVGHIVRAAWHTYRTSPGRVLGISLLIFVPATLLDGIGRHFNEEWDGPAGGAIALVVFVSLVASVANTFGASFYAGMLDYTVHAIRHDERQLPLRQIARDLPYLRMLGLSLAYAGVLVVAALLFVVPAFIAFVLLSISGPLLVTERLGVRAALRRSATLTRPHFWRVALVVLVPTLVESSVVDAVATQVGHTLLAEVAIHGALATVIYAYTILLEVHTAQWLVEEDRRTAGYAAA